MVLRDGHVNVVNYLNTCTVKKICRIIASIVLCLTAQKFFQRSVMILCWIVRAIKSQKFKLYNMILYVFTPKYEKYI